MRKSEKGYSLVVLIIAIIVILIITGGAISTLNMSMEERKINNFIYDINNIEEGARQYYSSTGTIPTLEGNVDISAFSSQIDFNDGATYSKLDITKLDLNNIHEPSKEYVINTDSLKVYMPEGIEYKGMTFYTVTDALMGTNTKYSAQDMDIICTTSPSVWTQKVNIRVTVPNYSGGNGWTFKYNIGPKDKAFFATSGNTFNYGETITVETNGAYSIYVKDSSGNEIVKNVVVKNIDDVKPAYSINGLTIMDNETGIKEIRYKTYSQYAANRTAYSNQGRSGEELDFYLLGGKGNTVESLRDDIANYKSQLNTINSLRTNLDNDYNALTEAEKAELSEQYNVSKQNLDDQKTQLEADYAHILSNIHYVLYVEDNANNAIVIVENYNQSTGKYILEYKDAFGNVIDTEEDALTFAKVCRLFNIEMP